MGFPAWLSPAQTDRNVAFSNIRTANPQYVGTLQIFNTSKKEHENSNKNTDVTWQKTIAMSDCVYGSRQKAEA